MYKLLERRGKGKINIIKVAYSVKCKSVIRIHKIGVYDRGGVWGAYIQ